MLTHKLIQSGTVIVLLLLLLLAGCASVAVASPTASASTPATTTTVTVIANSLPTITATSTIPPLSIPPEQTTSPYDWLVQVWEPGQLDGSGIVVGDGTQVLTTLNFEDTAPADMRLMVIAPDGTQHKATVTAIDSRTGAALLQLDGAKLPVAPINTTPLTSGQMVNIAGWDDYPTAPVFNQMQVVAGDTSDTGVALNILPDRYTNPPYNSDIPAAGGAVLDGTGAVVALLGVDDYFFFPHPTPEFEVPPAVNIGNALALLSPDADQQPWANGPLQYEVQSNGGGWSSEIPNYASTTLALQVLFDKMGAPIPAAQLPQSYYSMLNANTKSSFTLVYASPVELRNTLNEVVAHAKWVTFAFSSDGQTIYLYYGTDENGNQALVGGFTVLASMSDMQAVIPPMP